MTKTGKDLKFNILMWCVIIVGMVVACIFCVQKQGFHYDEYYSYYSTNITAGSHVYDREWRTGSDIKNEFMALQGDSLNLGLVKLNQSFDVHPPLYYFCLRIVSVLSKGVFSKWQGLAINLIFYFVCLILLWKISDIFGNGNKYINLFTMLMFVLSPGYLSTVTFIRMYVMLTAICFGVLLLTMKAMQKDRWDWIHIFIPSALLAFAGFMTHYYFMIFMFFLAAYTCIYLVIRKETRIKAFIYGGSVCAGMVAAVLYYPACISHIFSGYRGKEATEAFADMSNTVSRISFFVQILNDYTFSGMFFILVLVIILLYMFCSYRSKTAMRKKLTEENETSNASEGTEKVTASVKTEGTDKNSELEKANGGNEKSVVALLIFVTICYFLIVCKTGMMPSNPPEALRYECPAYGLIILIVVWAIFKLFEKVTKIVYIPMAIMAIAVLFQIKGLCSDKVFFIYKDAPVNVSWAADNGADDIVYIFNPQNEWMVWNDSSELMEYKNIYFIDANDTDPVDEQTITQMNEIYVYSCRSDNTDAIIQNVINANDNLNAYEKVSERLLIDIYKLY